MRKHLKACGPTGPGLRDPARLEERLEIGASDTPRGPNVYIKLGERAIYLTPDRAEEIAVDLRTYAIECRNAGGAA